MRTAEPRYRELGSNFSCRCWKLASRAPYAMKPDFQCVIATSNRGFMSFRRARSRRAAVLAVPG
jgi:hypothetical protein